MSVKKLYSLVFLRKHNQVLLGFKKRGFGMNKWNGFGGKVEANETIINAAARELEEECCVAVKPRDLKNVAHLEFTFEGDPILMDVRVFTTNIFEGTPMETEEMRPKWFNLEDIPYDTMWPDDKMWYPLMFNGKLLYGRFHFKGYDKILNYEIKELRSMEEFYASRK